MGLLVYKEHKTSEGGQVGTPGMRGDIPQWSEPKTTVCVGVVVRVEWNQEVLDEVRMNGSFLRGKNPEETLDGGMKRRGERFLNFQVKYGTFRRVFYGNRIEGKCSEVTKNRISSEQKVNHRLSVLIDLWESFYIFP